jgi:hypothetical protein
MNKQRTLRIINAILLVDLLALVTTVLLDDVLPRDIFYTVHPLLGFTLVILAISHIFLNWGWIKTNYLKKTAK